ncbi:hypothetical protein HPB48_002731 [Haemaphysalis longicornis]|uniref:Uncharacterized protein n=1 Tax=Haemaphysalis longicornis TaxID=44386 RepID=A0A9J6GNU9_HAELO|nr:hypothetical protein HPB48_002731 [Haemaphysalis longicornis]
MPPQSGVSSHRFFCGDPKRRRFPRAGVYRVSRDPPEKNRDGKFREQSIDGTSLPLLTEDHLTVYMGMRLGPALKLRTSLAKMTGRCTVCMHCIHCHGEENDRRSNFSASPAPAAGSVPPQPQAPGTPVAASTPPAAPPSATPPAASSAAASPASSK